MLSGKNQDGSRNQDGEKGAREVDQARLRFRLIESGRNSLSATGASSRGSILMGYGLRRVQGETRRLAGRAHVPGSCTGCLQGRVGSSRGYRDAASRPGSAG